MANLPDSQILASSFRDPSGFLFSENGNLYRQINKEYQSDFQKLIDSGLYDKLVSSGLLIPHEDASDVQPRTEDCWKIIKPEKIPFISYPYEWCFEQLKDAALLTLEIQKVAIAHGMILKDASAFNVQFRNAKPVFIDTLSFDSYQEGEPWVAYRQFCQHFLAPLALMATKDIRFNQFFRIYIDGVPLDLASKTLPWMTRFSFPLLTHIHLHAKAQEHYSGKKVERKSGGVSNLAMRGLIDNLETAIRKMSWHPEGTEWADYYNDTNYSDDSFDAKKQLVLSFIERVHPQRLWDLGANRGVFSRLASSQGIGTVSFDIDPSAVQKNYLEAKAKEESHLLPLVLDLTNPSPSLGWAHDERLSIRDREHPDIAMALALIHHLAFSNNLPFSKIAKYFASLSKYLIIEFVPREDSQAERLLQNRKNIFTHYNQESFENEFSHFYTILEAKPVPGTKRTLYLMQTS